MHPTEVVLCVVGAAGTVPGRTSLQKVCYFVEHQVQVPIGYKPHYYGPYSPAVSEAADSLVMADLLKDEVQRGSLASPRQTSSGVHMTEWRQHNYSLTDDGHEALRALESAYADQVAAIGKLVEQLSKVTKLSPTDLSLAAKYHFMREEEGIKKTREMITTAELLGWRLSLEQIEKGKAIADRLAV